MVRVVRVVVAVFDNLYRKGLRRATMTSINHTNSTDRVTDAESWLSMSDDSIATLAVSNSQRSNGVSTEVEIHLNG